MRVLREAVPLPVAIVCNNAYRGNKLAKLLRPNGIDVALYADLNQAILPQLEAIHPTVVIVDLDGGAVREQEIIDELLSQDSIPVLFNDGTCLEPHAPAMEQELGQQLAEKIFFVSDDGNRQQHATASEEPGVARAGAVQPEAANNGYHSGRVAEVVSYEHAAPPPAQQVWVLGASLGGPDAVKRFISQVPVELPVAFILAQRINARYLMLLEEQMRRVTDFQVLTANDGHTVAAGQVVIAPMDHQLGFDRQGRIHLMPRREDSHPESLSIDSVMMAVAEQYGSSTGAVVFSGIGNDGVLGARMVMEYGGNVWVQSSESCIMSSMPDHVRNACPVGFSASPEMLAQKLAEQIAASSLREAGPAAGVNALK